MMNYTELKKPSYFLCCRSDIPGLVKRAETEAAQILQEFAEFYSTTGKLDIVIEPIQHPIGYSIGGRLTWNGETLIEESDCALLFLQLNDVMLNRMLQLEWPSFLKALYAIS